MEIKSLLFFFISLFTVISCTRIPEGKQDLRLDVEDMIQERVDQIGITGLAAAVVYKGEVLFTRGFGYQDGKAAQDPVLEDTLFQIGSVTKIVTALAVMRLVDEGIVDLDADIHQYLTNFKPKLLDHTHAPVTVRNLLTHHSGIPSSFLKDFRLEYSDPDYFMQTSELLSEEYLTWESGTVWAYNNAGFSLLGELVGTVSGMSYAEYVEQKIFRPIGIDDALIYISDPNDPRVSGGFTAGEPESLMFIRDIPAGSILLSARHMGALVDELLACSRGESARIVQPETLRSMLVCQNGNIHFDDDFKIGLGFWLETLKGREMVGHSGTIPPFYSAMKLLPEEGTGIFLSSNDNLGHNFILEPLAKDVLCLLLDDDEVLNEDGDETSLQTRIPSEQEMRQIEGYYNMGSMGLFALEIREGQLSAKFPAMGMNAPVKVFSDNSLEIEELGLKLIPADEDGIDFFCYMGPVFVGPAVSVIKESLPESWISGLGRYTSDDFVSAVTLLFNKEAGTMVIEIELEGGKMAYALIPISETLLQVQGYGRGLGNVIEYTRSGLKDSLKYTGIQFIKEK